MQWFGAQNDHLAKTIEFSLEGSADAWLQSKRYEKNRDGKAIWAGHRLRRGYETDPPLSAARPTGAARPSILRTFFSC